MQSQLWLVASLAYLASVTALFAGMPASPVWYVIATAAGTTLLVSFLKWRDAR